MTATYPADQFALIERFGALALLARRELNRLAGRHTASPIQLKSLRYKYEADRVFYGFIEIDTQRLPPGLTHRKLVNPDTLHHLQMVIGHRVVKLNSTGLTYCIVLMDRRPDRDTLPTRVLFEATEIPIGDYMLPFGVGVNGPIWRSLSDVVGMLVGGNPRAGKSTYLNAIILALLQQYAAADLRLILIDPKAVEFVPYQQYRLPHLLLPVAVEPNEVEAAIQRITLELDERKRAFSSLGTKTLKSYNLTVVSKGQPSLPALLLIIDEFADLMDEFGRKDNPSLKLLKRVARMGPAFGLHCIIATQRPDSVSLDTTIRSILPTRVALSVSDRTASKMILGETPARGPDQIGTHQQGRMVVRLPDGTVTHLQGYDVPEPLLLECLTQQQDCARLDEIPAALYLRVSTAEQAAGYSIDEQRRACTEFAARHGWAIGEVYIDEGFSGTSGDRPEFQRLLADAEAGKSQVVVTHKIDRTYRNAQGMLRTFSDWQHQGVAFASVQEQIDFTTPWGKLILVVLSMLAEIFVDNLREETRKGKMGRFHAGLHNGHLPWGYCNGRCSNCTDPNGADYCPRFGLLDIHHERHAVPHPVDSEAFRLAHQLYRDGSSSDRDIAAYLNTLTIDGPEGESIAVRSRGKPGAKPGPFTKDFIREMLQNPFYAGVVPYYGSEYDGETVHKHAKPQDINAGRHLALISDTEFEQALQIREAKGTAPQGKGRADATQRGKSAPRQKSRAYVLQGLLDCNRCHAPLHSQAGGGKVRRHICSSRIQQKHSCAQPSAKADVLEAELAAQMSRITLPSDWQAAILAYLVDEAGLETIMAQREALHRHYEQVQLAYHRQEIGSPSSKPRYHPKVLVLELGLCTEDELWGLDPL